MTDARTATVTAFVLRHHLVGEADKLLVLLTREDGLRRVMAKGLRKANSRIGGRLEAFREATIQLARGRNMDVVTQVDSLRRFPAIATDYDALAAGMAANEALLAFLEDGDPHPEAYDLYAGLLAALGPGADSGLLLTAFELKLMGVLGYRPDLDHCVACDRALAGPEDAAGLHVEQGGAVCVHCEGLTSGRVRRLTGLAWQLLRAMQQAPYDAIAALAAPAPVVANGRHALREYLAFRAERELKAQGMFDWQPTP